MSQTLLENPEIKRVVAQLEQNVKFYKEDYVNQNRENNIPDMEFITKIDERIKVKKENGFRQRQNMPRKKPSRKQIGSKRQSHSQLQSPALR